MPIDTTAATRAVVAAALECWSRRDLDATMALVADHVLYVLNIDGGLAPYVRSVDGKPGVRENLRLLLEAFAFERFEVTSLKADGQMARAHISVSYRHQATREELSTSYHVLIEVTDGLITMIEENHDVRYVEAFLRLVRSEQRAKAS